MSIPDGLLDYLADRYYWACIDSSRLPFVSWAAREAERMGYVL